MQSLASLTIAITLFVTLWTTANTPPITTLQQRTVAFYCGYGEENHGAELCEYLQGNRFASNPAEKAVDMIVKPTGLKRNFILVPCPAIENAMAVTLSDGFRYIVYDNAFMEAINKGVNSDWASVSILAHEVGHHLNGHTLREVSGQERRNNELEADEFSGFAMFKLGRTLFEAQAAINNFADVVDEERSTHPKKWRRLKAIEKGYENAKSQEPSQLPAAGQPWVVIHRNEIAPAIGTGYSGSFGYVYRGAGVKLTRPDDKEQTGSKLLLFENGILLKPHSMHADIQGRGMGLYSHWFDGRIPYLRFSSSDNSDPRTNNRVYIITVAKE